MLLGENKNYPIEVQDFSVDMSQYFNKWIKFQCQDCSKLVIKKVRKGRTSSQLPYCHKCGQQRTCLEKYGVKTNLIIHANPKQVWQDKKGQMLEKRKQTSLEKYGYESPNQDPIVRKKMHETKVKNGSYEVQKLKSKITKLERYGDETFTMQTNLDRL